MPEVLRRTADPKVSVSSLMTVLEGHLSRRKTKDLFASLETPDGKAWGWKRANHAGWMAKSAPLMHGLVQVVPNGVLSSVKLKLAIQKLLDSHKCTTAKGHTIEDCLDLCDQMVRILLQQYRSILDCKDEYYKVCRKLSAEEKNEVDTVLSAMVKPGDEKAQLAPEELQMVPWEPPVAKQEASGSSTNIFKRILSKKDSETSAAPSADLSVAQPLPKSNPSSGSKPVVFGGLLAGDVFSPSQASSAFASPAEKKGKRRRKTKKQSPVQAQRERENIGKLKTFCPQMNKQIYLSCCSSQ